MSAADASAAPAADQPPSDEFWAAKWSKMDTPWRTLEREAGQPKYPHPMHQVIRYPSRLPPPNCPNFLLNLTDPLPYLQNTDALFKHAQLPGLDGRSSADFSGVRVLIPLCGDTPALKFFAELGCHVTGVELVQTVRSSPSHRLHPT
jgi:hypothetical protein